MPADRHWRGLVSAVIADRPQAFAWVAAVQLAAAAAQGVGILLLVPLLHRAGVGTPGGASSFTVRGLLSAYVAVVAAAALLSGYASVLQTRYRLEFVDALRDRVYRAIAGAEWRHLLTVRQSDLLTTLTVNVGQVQVGVSALLTLAVTMALVAVQVVVAFRVSPAVAGLATGTGAVIVTLLWPVLRQSRRFGRELVGANRAVVASVTGFLDGLKLAKAHGLETAQLDTFTDAIRGGRRAQIRFATVSALATGAQLVLIAVVLAVVVDVAIERFDVDVARLLVVAFAFSRIVPQITNGQRNLQQVAQAVPSFDDLLGVVVACEAAADPIGVADPVVLRRDVTVRDVSFRYPAMDRPALDGVSLKVRAKRTTTLVGPSGAGKTTLADIVAGLLPPDTGDVTIDGTPLDDATLASWRNSIALVPQEPFLWHVSVADNLRWAAPDATDDDLWAALRLAAADRFVAALPHGLDTIVGDRGVRLSGGERQRVALARALLRQPTLLILDEATSSLDTENEQAIRAALDALAGTLTMVVIAHRLSTVRHADAIVVLDHGRVVETGTWSRLAAKSRGRLRALIDAGMVE